VRERAAAREGGGGAWLRDGRGGRRELRGGGGGQGLGVGGRVVLGRAGWGLGVGRSEIMGTSTLSFPADVNLFCVGEVDFQELDRSRPVR